MCKRTSVVLEIKSAIWRTIRYGLVDLLVLTIQIKLSLSLAVLMEMLQNIRNPFCSNFDIKDCYAN